MDSMGSYVVLRVGRATLLEHDAPMNADAAGGWFVLRTGKGYALLFTDVTLGALADDDEVAAEEIVTRLGADLLGTHREKRGILLADVDDPTDEPVGDDYDVLVKELQKRGKHRWVVNKGKSALLTAVERSEIPVPDPPRATMLDFHVIPVPRAMREYAFTDTPKRVVRRNLRVKATTADIVSFYLPKMEKAGFEVQHDAWPKKKTEEVDGLRNDARLVIGAVETSPGEVFVQLLYITL